MTPKIIQLSDQQLSLFEILVDLIINVYQEFPELKDIKNELGRTKTAEDYIRKYYPAVLDLINKKPVHPNLAEMLFFAPLVNMDPEQIEILAAKYSSINKDKFINRINEIRQALVKKLDENKRAIITAKNSPLFLIKGKLRNLIEDPADKSTLSVLRNFSKIIKLPEVEQQSSKTESQPTGRFRYLIESLEQKPNETKPNLDITRRKIDVSSLTPRTYFHHRPTPNNPISSGDISVLKKFLSEPQGIKEFPKTEEDYKELLKEFMKPK